MIPASYELFKDRISSAIKLYWREERPGRWHCFMRLRGAGVRAGYRWVSLCGDWELAGRVGGQGSVRPEPIMRCARCDNSEATARGADESLPPTRPR